MFFSIKKVISSRWVGLFFIISAVLYTCWYLTFSNPFKSYGALSIIGLRHPFLFSIWGFLAEAALFINLQAAYKRASYKNRYTNILLALGLTSILITIFVPFQFERLALYIIHCYGAISFIVYHGIAMLILFFKFYRQKSYCIAGCLSTVILLTTLLLFLIIGESGILEAAPMFLSFLILGAVNFSKHFEIKSEKKKKELIYR